MLRIFLLIMLFGSINILGVNVNVGDFYVMYDKNFYDDEPLEETVDFTLAFFRREDKKAVNIFEISLGGTYEIKNIYKVLLAKDGTFYIGIEHEEGLSVNTFKESLLEIKREGLKNLRLLNSNLKNNHIYLSADDLKEKLKIFNLETDNFIETHDLTEIIMSQGPNDQGYIYILGKDSERKRSIYMLTDEGLSKLKTIGIESIQAIYGNYFLARDENCKKALFMLNGENILPINTSILKKIKKVHFSGLENSLYVSGDNSDRKTNLLFIMGGEVIDIFFKEIENYTIHSVHGPDENGITYMLILERPHKFGLNLVKDKKIIRTGNTSDISKNNDDVIIMTRDGTLYYKAFHDNILRFYHGGPNRVLKKNVVLPLLDNIVS